MWKLAYICWLEMGIGCQLGRRVWFGGGMVPFAVPCMAGIEYRRKMKKDGTIADSIPG